MNMDRKEILSGKKRICLLYTSRNMQTEQKKQKEKQGENHKGREKDTGSQKKTKMNIIHKNMHKNTFDRKSEEIFQSYAKLIFLLFYCRQWFWTERDSDVQSIFAEVRRYLTAHFASQMFHDRQPESGTGTVSCRICPVKAFKKTCLLYTSRCV